MTPEFKAQWIEALRSGRYKQAQGTLYRQTVDGYCCLGVLCKVLAPDLPITHVNSLDNMLDHDVRVRVGMDSKMMDECIFRNDGAKGQPQHSFAEIADWLEKTEI